MTKSKYYLLLGAVLVLAMVLAGVLAFMWLRSREPEPTPARQTYNEYTPTGNVSQTVEEPEVESSSETDNSANNTGTPNVTPTVDNTDLAESLEPEPEMQQVIDNTDQADINNAEVVDQLAQSYPSNVIPVYKAATAADSMDIITSNGRPGWTANYGSDATVDEIAGFYEELMKGTQGYSAENEAQTTTIKGTVDNCSVSISISPNNPERTGLDEASSVSIFIERV